MSSSETHLFIHALFIILPSGLGSQRASRPLGPMSNTHEHSGKSDVMNGNHLYKVALPLLEGVGLEANWQDSSLASGTRWMYPFEQTVLLPHVQLRCIMYVCAWV